MKNNKGKQDNFKEKDTRTCKKKKINKQKKMQEKQTLKKQKQIT